MEFFCSNNYSNVEGAVGGTRVFWLPPGQVLFFGEWRLVSIDEKVNLEGVILVLFDISDKSHRNWCCSLLERLSRDGGPGQWKAPHSGDVGGSVLVLVVRLFYMTCKVNSRITGIHCGGWDWPVTEDERKPGEESGDREAKVNGSNAAKKKMKLVMCSIGIHLISMDMMIGQKAKGRPINNQTLKYNVERK